MRRSFKCEGACRIDPYNEPLLWRSRAEKLLATSVVSAARLALPESWLMTWWAG